ncbi:MAG TPA: glycoside hydrolase family 3 N-terminal domain-containing protein [Lacipirellulaceae bacterium]|nr:glycoside hydrolase family 3 N-terminal domain-containing protein [Lacipirellulaceae bacterium]
MTGSTQMPKQPPTALRDKLAQLIFVRIGSNMKPARTVEQDEHRITKLLEACPIGGLLLFNGGPNTKESLERLQEASQIPLLVASDIERGVGQQVKGCTLFPHAMAFEKLPRNTTLTVAEFAEASAREARDVGIHISFSPVADVNTNPQNPIIATRAFSENAYRAADLAAAYVNAAEAAGLRTTAKHFPGHGDTQQDSHDSLPSVPRSLEQLEACELVPFRSAIDAGCSLVMTAHVAFPEIDPSGVPATLSPIILNDLLRKQLGFRGVVCSDSLLMAGVRDQFDTEEEMALAVLNAGVDLLLDVNDPGRIVDFLCESVDCGKLSQQRVDDAFTRMWELKRRALFDLNNALLRHAVPSSIDPMALAQRVAQGAIEIIGNAGRTDVLPLNPDVPLVVVLLKPFQTPIDPLEQPLAAALRQQFPAVKYLQLGPKADVADYQAAVYVARDAQQLLVAMIIRPAAWYAFGLLPEQKEFVEWITKERAVVLASLGVPYALRDFPDAAMRICTYSDVPVSQHALADFLLAPQR